MEIEYVKGVDAISARAGALLLADEARHSLALGILSTARTQPATYPDIRAWLVCEGARVVGAALQTPPHNLVLAAPVRREALAALAGAVDAAIPGVVGGVPEVDAFARAWARPRASSIAVRFEQRIYALRELRPPPPTDGTFRLTDASDRRLLLDWVSAFAAEALAGGPATDTERLLHAVESRLAGYDSGFGLWEVDGRPVSLAGFGGATPNSIRIGPVYTPPEHRGRGYGSAITAAVSQLNLERGRRFCFLYTDLANPTSNSIYLRIGFEPVCDSRELAFGSQRGRP